MLLSYGNDENHNTLNSTAVAAYLKPPSDVVEHGGLLLSGDERSLLRDVEQAVEAARGSLLDEAQVGPYRARAHGLHHELVLRCDNMGCGKIRRVNIKKIPARCKV